MERIKDLNTLLRQNMSVNNMDIEMPHSSLLDEAREKVFMQRKKTRPQIRLIDMLLQFIKLEVKLYHLCVSVMLISAGFFYINDTGYSNYGPAGLMSYSASALSIKNNTISVNSGTMLTSIPTLVIRN